MKSKNNFEKEQRSRGLALAGASPCFQATVLSVVQCDWHGARQTERHSRREPRTRPTPGRNLLECPWGNHKSRKYTLLKGTRKLLI